MRKISDVSWLVLLLVCGFAAWASGPLGSIVGTVVDPSGAVVRDAKVEIRNEATGASRVTVTRSEGDFSAPLLPPGSYEIAVEAPNFRTAVRKGVVVNVNDVTRADFQLVLGETSSTLTVTDTPPPVNGETSMIGHILDRRRVVGLPLNERNFLTFSLLVPGAQMPADGSQNSTQGFAVSVNGAREQSNTFLLNGIDNNDPSINFYAMLPSVDAIEEFQVQTANSSAEFGRTAGAQVNVVLRSGSNRVRGTAFGFLRNRHLDARNYFDLPDCTSSSAPGTCGEIPRLDRTQFGGTLGGPIRRDRTFAFGSYEGLRLNHALTRAATVPSHAQKDAALSSVPIGQRNSAGVGLLNLYPAANAGQNLSTSNIFVSQPLQKNTIHQVLGRLDHSFSPRDMAYAHYGHFDEDRYNPFDPFTAFTNLPGFGTESKNKGQNAGGSWIHTFSSNSVNELRGGFGRLRARILNESSGINHSEELGFPTVLSDPITWGYPNVGVLGFDGIGEPTNTPQERTTTTMQVSNVWAWSPSFHGGRHRIKVGAEFRHVDLDFYLYVLARGQWMFLGAGTGDSLGFLLRGLPDFAVGVKGTTDSGFRTHSQNYFIQDDIRLHPRLTLNLGLRYEYNRPPVETEDRMSVPRIPPPAGGCAPTPDCLFIRVGTEGVPRAGFGSDRNNFAPRVGLAWRADEYGRTVVRAAYGMFYDLSILNVFIGGRFNPPFFQTTFHPNFGNGTIQTILDQPAFPLPPSPMLIASDYRDPYIQQWNLNVQRDLGKGFVGEAAYAGSKGTRLFTRRNPNQGRPGGAPIYPQFGAWQSVESSALSTYHSLQFRVEKRLSRGMTFLSAYTFSKSLDNASSYGPSLGEAAFPQDSYNLRAEHGPSSFDARHRLAVSGLYELPFGKGRRWLTGGGAAAALFGGWSTSGILAAQAGRPFTVTRAIDQSGTGTIAWAAADRPDLVADPFVPGPVPANPDPACGRTISQGGRAADVVRDPSSWFNACAFSAANGRFGNAGRNNLVGPRLVNLDLALLKDIPLSGETRRLQFRAEAFNLLNHPNFDLPDRVFDSLTFARVRSSNAYGTKPPRQIQLALKFIF